MNKSIKVKNVIYNISGEWSIDRATKVFKGKLLDEDGEIKMDLNFKIPISAIKKIGLDYFEECIENDLKIEIEKKL